jgi:hypothetical protein
MRRASTTSQQTQGSEMTKLVRIWALAPPRTLALPEEHPAPLMNQLVSGGRGGEDEWRGVVVRRVRGTNAPPPIPAALWPILKSPRSGEPFPKNSSVFGAFTRALRDADLKKREEYLRRDPGRQRQGIVPDLQIGTGTALYELRAEGHALGSQPLQLQWCAGDRSEEEGG